MNILILSEIQVYPCLSGGQIRTGSFARALAELGHDVSIYSFTGRKKDYLTRKESSATLLENGVNEFVNRQPFFGACQWLAYKLEQPPLWSNLFARLHTPKKLRELADEADLIIVDFPFLYPIATRLGKPWHLNTHNVEHQLWQNSLLSSVIVPLVRKMERSAAKKADLVIACAPADQAYFAELNSVVLVPNGIFPEDYRIDPETRKTSREELGVEEDETLLIFLGSNFGPNRSALTRLQQFCNDERTFLNDSKVKIVVVGTVGENSGIEAKQELNDVRIHETGFVDSIQPYLAAADFALNPVFEGSGANVKNSEYISSKLPMLLQEFGTRGFQLENKVSCLKFDFDSFVDSLNTAVKLSKDERRAMANRAFTENEADISMRAAVKKYLAESS
jgi:glycosyltransferase involved in cell wall biosynthesis